MADTLRLPTSYKGEGHITSDDMRHKNASLVGPGTYCFGDQPSVSMTDANTVSIGAAELMVDGMYARITDEQTVSIESGAEGYFRRDLIVLRYVCDSTDKTEAPELHAITGEPSDTSAGAVDPTTDYMGQSALDGALIADYPIVRVTLSGLTPTAEWLVPSHHSMIELDATSRLADNDYPGVNIAEVFAAEIAAAGSVYAFLHRRAQAGDYHGLHLYDYLDVTLSDANHTVMRYEIGAFDHAFNCGDTPHPHHLFMVPRNIYDQEVHWNNTNNNNGNSTNANPYVVCNLHGWENGTYLNYLPEELRGYLLNYRTLSESRYQSGSTLTDSTGWVWVDNGKVFSLSEMEVYGCCVWGTPKWSVGMDSQLPIFRETKNRIRHTTPTASDRRDWWLRVAHSGSSTYACCVYGNGTADSYSTTLAGIRPLPCFLIG